MSAGVPTGRDDTGSAEALEGYREERRSAVLYMRLATIEREPSRSAMFTELAAAAGRQAELWAQRLRAGGTEPPPDEPLDARARAILWLTAKLGVARTRQMLATLKVRGLAAYSSAPPAAHGPVGDDASRIGQRHRTGAGNLRAAVFGANDGLISNASLIFGMAGAATSQDTLLLTGLAGLLAGALSMAAGEYVSVLSQREFHEYQIALEAAELAEYPEAEAEELALIYRTKGLGAEQAHALAHALVADPDKALDTLAREELGLNPDELGSPIGAALASFGAFALGAIIPVLPIAWLPPAEAVVGTVVAAAASLFAIGAALSWFTGRPAFASGLRMLVIGAAAGATSYGIGSWIGASIGG